MGHIGDKLFSRFIKELKAAQHLVERLAKLPRLCICVYMKHIVAVSFRHVLDDFGNPAQRTNCPIRQKHTESAENDH